MSDWPEVTFLDGRVRLIEGDCREVMSGLDADSVDAVVTDPPYHFASIVKRFGADDAAPAKSEGATGVYERASAGFMGKKWDGGDIAFQPATWAAALRVLKPGGHMVAFGAPKNAHRLACAIEDAGFEIRDALMWVFGTGFPKSHNIGDGWGTALKPAYEPIILARKPLIGTVAENVLAHGTGAINIDACRVEAMDGVPKFTHRREPSVNTYGDGKNGSNRTGEIDRTTGRWPANLVHDGSEDVLAAFPNAPGQQGALTGNEPSPTFSGDVIYGKMARSRASTPRGDSGSAARFFYTAKASKTDRAGSKHPTVKPVDLMRWLCRLVTPPGGTILDPFAGTGTTGEAAWREGFDAILIEREPEYQADIERRMRLCMAGPDERKRESIKAKLAAKPIDAGPLFGDVAL